MNRLQRVAMLLALTSLPWLTKANNVLPDMGTAAAAVMSIDKEIRYGNAYMRVVRATQPITYDPVLTEYLTSLGHRLVANADQIRTPFHFFLVTDNDINAAAFLGGYVKVHTGLFLNARSESELASVLAHEIAHVTQRHIARSIENSAASQKMSVAGIVGSVLLGIANPVAGIAALQTTIAINAQSAINYTRQNEFEADRIGMQILSSAGFRPEGMTNFFGRLAEKYRYANQLPEMLQTHPLADTRINEARARAAQMPNRYLAPSLDYQFAKARIQVRFSPMTAAAALSYFEQQLKSRDFALQDAALYGKALALLELQEYPASTAIIDALIAKYPNNLFLLDTQTDLDLAQDKITSAITRLKAANLRYPDNRVVIMNLAAAYQQGKQFGKAATLLDHYTRRHPEDSLGWKMLTESYGRMGKVAQSFISRAEYLALAANYERAIDELHSAANLSQDPQEKMRIDARIEQFKIAEQTMKDMK